MPLQNASSNSPTEADADRLDRVKKIVQERVPPREAVLIAPFLTTLYCALEKESPVWEIYFYLPQPEAVQKKIIRQLEERKVKWAILGNLAPDGIEERRLSNTHPLLWEYLMTHFDAASDEEVWQGHYLIKRKA